MYTVDTFTNEADLADIRFRDFHQHPDRLSILSSQHVEATGLVVYENDGPSCFALLERANDRWYMWRGPEGSPNPAALRALLAACPQQETVTLILRPDWVHVPTLIDVGWRLTASWSTLHVRACDSGEALLAGMRSSARGRVRRAQRAGLRFAMGAHLLDRYYPVYAQAMVTSGSPDFASR
ncbi:MAG: hypothetical protein JO115_20555, partial [Pseudonocardiales bacterium]|nr:hypothetical protein [Pseudonocardiales bacterium]